MNDPYKLLNIKEAAKFLSVSETSLRRWTNSGALSCLRVGQRRERRFRLEDLLAFMEQPGGRHDSAVWKDNPPGAKRHGYKSLTIARGNHLCGIYGSDAGRLSLSVPFMLEGLREGSTCLLIVSSRAKAQIIQNLRDLHPRLDSDLKEGRLVFGEYKKSARAQWKQVAKHLKTAQAAGDSSFRILGDVAVMRALVSPKELVEYETGFDERIVSQFPVAVLCIYDARVFSGIELLNALRIHGDTLQYPVAPALA